MRRPGLATLGSVLLHAAIVAVALVPWPRKTPEVIVSSVPVSIISSETVAAAPADNPADEAVPEDGTEAPEPVEAETPPEPTPPPPTPPQPQSTPAPTPAPRPAPQPNARPTPTPTRPTPPAPTPTPPRKEPSLDLDSLAQPSRPNRPATRPATGDSGQGQAARATGAQIANLGGQITRHWTLQCDIPGFSDVSIPVRVTISSTGRITDGPTLTERRNDAVWRTASESMLRAVRAAEPFDVPAGFQTQEINFRFRADQACRNR